MGKQKSPLGSIHNLKPLYTPYYATTEERQGNGIQLLKDAPITAPLEILFFDKLINRIEGVLNLYITLQVYIASDKSTCQTLCQDRDIHRILVRKLR